MSARVPPPHAGPVVVLMYHAVGDEPLPPPERRYQVATELFAQHLDFLAAGRAVQRLADVWRGEGARTEAGAACLTFDDGRASDYRAVFPMLLARRCPADFFINPATVGSRGYLGWDQIREMSAAGLSFQSHAHDHVPLTTLGDRDLHWQLRASKRRIEDALGLPVDFLAAPFGDVNRRVVRAALREGYRAVCTSWSWPARPGASTVSRAAVYPAMTVIDLERLLAGHAPTYAARAVRSAALYLPKRLVHRLRRGGSEAPPPDARP